MGIIGGRKLKKIKKRTEDEKSDKRDGAAIYEEADV